MQSKENKLDLQNVFSVDSAPVFLMASKKKTNVAKKFTPVNRFLRYQITTSGTANTETSHFIDIMRDLSASNRRLYRQHKVVQIANISVTSRNTNNGLISFSTAPDTWVTRAALRRGKKMHEEMASLALDLPGSEKRKGRWNDFKVYLSDDHRLAQSDSNKTPRTRDNGNLLAGSGEWVYSKFQSPDGQTGSDEFRAHILGAHTPGADPATNPYTSIGLIQSYGEARATVNDDTPLVDSQGSDDPLLNLFDAGTQVDEIANDLENDGDNPPYKILQSGDKSTIGEHYPGASSNMPKPIVNRLAAIGQQGGSSAPTVMLPGFTALCGLLEIEVQSASASDEFDITIEIAPGSYKGIAAFDI